jgi:hypothetical protein
MVEGAIDERSPDEGWPAALELERASQMWSLRRKELGE